MNLHTKALTKATVTSIALVTILTIWSELSSPFKTFLANITGHHWVTKSVFSVIVFIGSYLVFSKFLKDTTDVKKIVTLVVATTVIGGLIIFLFYVWHFYSG